MRKLIAWIKDWLFGWNYINWAKIPEGYDWVGNDGQDGTFAHREKPIPYPNGLIGWYSSSWINIRDRDAIIAPLPPWRESLRRRPI